MTHARIHPQLSMEIPDPYDESRTVDVLLMSDDSIHVESHVSEDVEHISFDLPTHLVATIVQLLNTKYKIK